ncbi:hypothetical protein JY96_21415 [Aquabacterium sp. NJ1]|uniref:type-F conjugative transfer system protein TraW n=1 Tax=Aquabacterium sp. NJ1 TaxID=1538295 RepID=UPI00052C068B|nr:type-F conjugative transfer system protein TraW [Aquabacterium sp. NJ1]KGM38732.1 hypothetical protein JY96_21415 [Aquabacterium sp. NJ1]
MTPRIVAVAVLIVAQWSCGQTQAKDLGRAGPVYEIAEPDLLQDITNTLKQKEATGELQKIQQEYSRRAMNVIEHPTPVSGLTTTFKKKVFWYDPTVVVEENIVDGRGAIIVPVGTRKNPLDYVTLKRKWLFIDGQDEKQVRLARAAVEDKGDAVRVVLTNGAPLELSRRWKWPVYFDQHGIYVSTFGITHVPAWVEQDGKRIRITEVPAGL